MLYLLAAQRQLPAVTVVLPPSTRQTVGLLGAGSATVLLTPGRRARHAPARHRRRHPHVAE
ncbi:hypothetical protein [Streptomyces luteogriseus]|uniref:hypothetical protein n=1 Tax=Streptomyces luteogriseus TaxID=68233 RepID=UPI0036AD45EA